MKIVLITASESEVSRALVASYNSIVVSSEKSRTECINEIKRLSPNIIITYRCRHIIPAEIIEKVDVAINIHPSLLPMYAGLNPWKEMEAVDETIGGITIHHLSDLPDCGQIILQRPMQIDFSKGMEWNRNRSDILAAKLIKNILKYSL